MVGLHNGYTDLNEMRIIIRMNMRSSRKMIFLLRIQ